MDGKIIGFTEQVAANLKARFVGDPKSELAAWLKIAQQREAMVTRVYGLGELSARFTEQGLSEVTGVAVKAIKGIWVQEEGHTTVLGAVRRVDGNVLPVLQEIEGKLEGDTTRAAARGSWLARLIIAVGSSLGKVPAFAQEIDAMCAREFFQFCRELEETAALGYDRMVDLAMELREKEFDDNAIYILPYELGRILREERYHGSVFDKLVAWLSDDGASFRPLDARACVLELHDLARHHFELGVLRETDRRFRSMGKPSPQRDANATLWISHGGCDELFRDFDLPVPLADQEQALAGLS
jgi:hypothetical protein